MHCTIKSKCQCITLIFGVHGLGFVGGIYDNRTDQSKDPGCTASLPCPQFQRRPSTRTWGSTAETWDRFYETVSAEVYG
jgi:hypothetical protein